MIDTVHCYFESIGSPMQHEAVIPIWNHTWKQFGWNTRVLGKADALKHPLHDKLIEHVNTLPTLNSHDYENACYRRHLAMALVGDGLMTDYDVINMAFHPSDLPPMMDTLETLDACGVPCATFGTSVAWNKWVGDMMRYTKNGSNHISDMTIFHSMNHVKHSHCFNLDCPGWESHPLIHFHQEGINRIRPGVPRHKVISEFLSNPVHA